MYTFEYQQTIYKLVEISFEYHRISLPWTKSLDCLDWIPQDSFIFYKSLDWIPQDFFIFKNSFI